MRYMGKLRPGEAIHEAPYPINIHCESDANQRPNETVTLTWNGRKEKSFDLLQSLGLTEGSTVGPICN